MKFGVSASGAARRIASFFLLLTVVAALAATAAVTKISFRPSVPTISPLLELSGQWELCLSDGPHIPVDCAWIPATLPGVVPSDAAFAGWGHFRKMVFVPEACQEAPCALLLGEVAQVARVQLGGHSLGAAGIMPPARAPDRIYPHAFILPNEAPGGSTHTLQISLMGPKPKHAGVTKGPMTIVLADDARAFVKAHSVGTVFVPLAIALGLVLVAGALALYAFVCPPEDMLLLYAVGAYCIINVVFLLSFADQNYDFLPMDLATPLRYSARRCNDVALVTILYLWLGFSGAPRIIFRGACAAVTGIGVFGIMYVWLHRISSSDPLVIVEAIATMTKHTWGVKFVGPVAAMIAALVDWRRPRRRVESLALLSLISLFAYDSAIFWGSPLGDYASRFHVLILACLFSGLVIRRATERATRQQLYAESEAELGRAARQVAHDIRSPLAALNHLLRSAKGMEENHRVLLRSASGRINDIANQLLFKGREAEIGPALEQTLLLQSLEAIVTEMRMRYRARLRIAIDLSTDEDVHLAFVRVSSTQLQRSLANLINNAVEAIGDKSGSVSVSAHIVDARYVELCVKDTGPGIPAHILGLLGQSGATFNKKGGSGLGLSHAKEFAETAAGRFEIRSQVGEGTSVVLTLPLVEAPGWFATTLKVAQDQDIIIVDDDDSIHQIWRSRLSNLGAVAHRGRQLHMSTPHELRRYTREQAPRAGALYLIDYELLGFAETGVDLIVELALKDQAVLVTSRADEAEVQKQCSEHRIQILPKSIAGHMPIEVLESQAERPAGEVRVHAVVIDDDPLIHQVWAMTAKKRGQRYIHVRNPKDAFSSLEDIDKATPIFVDYNLGALQRGDEMTRRIADLGYRRVFLMTGEDEGSLPTMPWLAGVMGKEPPEAL